MNTKQAAESIAKQLSKSIAGYTDETPTVRQDGNNFEVVLESGPADWAMNDNYGLFEELKGYGLPGDYTFKPFWKTPKGFIAEPNNSFSVTVYRD